MKKIIKMNQRYDGTVKYWNFLPPDELDTLVGLYQRVSGKALVISKALGVEGGAFIHPKDKLDPLKEMAHLDELLDGQDTIEDEMRLALKALTKDWDRDGRDLEAECMGMPEGIFSGRALPDEPVRGVFLCYQIPAPDLTLSPDGEQPEWSMAAGETRWYLVQPDEVGGDELTIVEDLGEIFKRVRCPESEPRVCVLDRAFLERCLKRVDKHITNGILKRLNAPMGVDATLVAWMELS